MKKILITVLAVLLMLPVGVMKLKVVAPSKETRISLQPISHDFRVRLEEPIPVPIDPTLKDK